MRKYYFIYKYKYNCELNQGYSTINNCYLLHYTYDVCNGAKTA